MSALVVWLFCSPSAHAAASENALPADAALALAQARSLTLYSLEDYSPEDGARVRASGENLRSSPVLGKVVLEGESARAAVAELEQAIAGWDGSVAGCFEPHHGFRVEAASRGFEFLICYACGTALVFEEGRREQIGAVGISGFPTVLNRLLSEANVRLAHVYSPEYLAEQAREARKRKAAYERWLAAMPPSIRASWTEETALSFDVPLPLRPDVTPEERARHDARVAPFRALLRRDFASEHQSVRALLAWFGSGAGPWSGFPAYEIWPEALLSDYETHSIIAAIESAPLSAAQREGAARYLAGSHFRTSGNPERIPAAMRAKLLAHVRATAGDDEDKLARAATAFR